MAKRGPSHIDRRSQDGGPKTAAPTASGNGGAGIDRIDRDDALFAFSLADSHGNPLDDVDPVSALVPGFFAIERLRFPDASVARAHNSYSPGRASHSLLHDVQPWGPSASPRSASRPLSPPSALNSTRSTGPKPDQARPSIVILPASRCLLRERKSGMPGDHERVRVLAGYGRAGVLLGALVVVRERLLDALERFLYRPDLLEPLDGCQAVTEKLEALSPDLPPLPEGESDPDDEGWLFESRRGYLEQLSHYKAR
jgi:hypothetical protein